MSEPTDALIYETLKKVQADLASVKQTVEQHTIRFNNLENYMATSRRETADF